MEAALHCHDLNTASTSGFWRISIEYLRHPITKYKIEQPQLKDSTGRQYTMNSIHNYDVQT